MGGHGDTAGLRDHRCLGLPGQLRFYLKDRAGGRVRTAPEEYTEHKNSIGGVKSCSELWIMKHGRTREEYSPLGVSLSRNGRQKVSGQGSTGMRGLKSPEGKGTWECPASLNDLASTWT